MDHSSPLNPVPKVVEQLSRSLDFGQNEWRQSMQILADYGGRFLDGIAQGWAYHPPTLPPGGKTAPPSDPEDLAKLLGDFDQIALQSGIAPTSGKFFGYIPGGGLPIAAIGDCIASLTNRYSGSSGAGPGAVEIENQVVEWLRDLLNWPGQSWGTLQSGGSMATLTALIAARSTRPFERWSRGVIYVSEESHHCFLKAALIVGLEACPTRYIATDAVGRMDIDALRQQITDDQNSGLEPWIICATAGTTNLGAVDPLLEIHQICQSNSMWMHIDAAYGGFFWLTERGKNRLSGLECGDSIVLDPHKSLFQPYGLGIVLVRNGELLRKSLSSRASYLRDLPEDGSRSPMDYSPELTRPFRALRLWFALKFHGLEAFKAALDEKLYLTAYAAQALRLCSELEVLTEPELSVVAFRIKGSDSARVNPSTAKLQQLILSSGEFHLSSTEIHGFTYLRICILSFRSHFEEVEACIQRIKSIAEESFGVN